MFRFDNDEKNSAQKQILVIDDEPANVCLLRDILEIEYKVMGAIDAEEGLRLAECEQPDLIIVDVRMPKMSGYELCERLRQGPRTRAIPVLMVSALDSVEARIEAFRRGGDDFIGKPFHPTEIRARVNSKIQRFGALPSPPVEYRCCNLTMRPETMQVKVDDRDVELSLIEFKILQYLFEHKGKVLSREAIMEAVWTSVHVSRRNIDARIATLRKKLKGYRCYIHSVYQVGYVMRCSANIKVEVNSEPGNQVGA